MKSIKYLNEEKEKIKKYAEPDNPLQNMADHVGVTQIEAQIEILKDVLWLIDKINAVELCQIQTIEQAREFKKKLKQRITGGKEE